MSLYQTAVKKPVTTALIFIGVAIFGLYSLLNIPINLYPEIDANTIMVITSYNGASAADIETNLTKPLENVLNSISDLKHVTSKSRENISVITLEFEYGIDIDVATNDVRDKLEMVKSQLPDDAGNPVIFKFGADDIPILILGVTADESTPGLYKILDDQVSNPLARISGVGAVSISGLAKREINVYCDPHKLESYNLTVEAIAQVIGAENKNTPGGNIDIGNQTYSMRVQKEFEDAQDMRNIIVGSYNGKNVYLKDVAVIVDGLQERIQETYNNQRKGGMIVVQKQSGANSVLITNKVLEMLPKLQESLPSDVKLEVMINTSDNIINTIDSLKETIIITFIIVMLVVYFFLARWRATFIIILTIPISLLASLIYLFATGNTLNIVSLSALSIAIGMVVDDAIVVLENVTTHIERGSRPHQAAVHATNEVAISVIASTLTMLAVFLPLTMIKGMAGVLFKQLGWIISIIMIVSTIGALSLIPMLCGNMLRLNPNHGKLHHMIFDPIERFLDKLDIWYSKIIAWAVHHRKTVVFGMAIIFVGTLVGLGPLVKSEFFPSQDNARISVKIQLPVGTRQEITRDFAYNLTDEFMKEYPEITFCNFSEGTADSDNIFSSFSDNGSHIISMNISLVSVEDRSRGLLEICEGMRAIIAKYPIVRTFQVIAGGQQGGMSGQSTAQVEIYGYDFAATDKAAADLRQRLLSYPTVNEVFISRNEYVPEFQVNFDREKLAINGLNTTTASMYLRNRFNGYLASYYREDGKEYDIKVRYAPEFRTSIEDIENITIYNNAGQAIKLRELGKVEELLTPPTIERKDRERYITVNAVVPKGMALSDMVEIVNKEMKEVEMAPGLSWKIGGTYENQNDTFRDISMLMVLVLILVFIVMAAQFESLTYPFVIMFSVPFAITGVLMGLVFTGTTLSVMALIGLLMLLGIVVKNGIVLIDYTILCRERGLGISNSVVTAGKSRLRPVLMTTLTTVLGMVPLAIGTGEGSEMWKGMGMAVAWGLSVSTVITLVIVPTVYCSFAGREIKRRRKKELKAFKAEARLAK